MAAERLLLCNPQLGNVFSATQRKLRNEIEARGMPHKFRAELYFLVLDFKMGFGLQEPCTFPSTKNVQLLCSERLVTLLNESRMNVTNCMILCLQNKQYGRASQHGTVPERPEPSRPESRNGLSRVAALF